MKRRLYFIIAVVLALAVNPSGVHAAKVIPHTAGCTIHGASVQAWSEQGNWLTGGGQFNCHPGYRIEYFPQYQEPIGGKWTIGTCGSDFHLCHDWVPDATSWWGSGSGHNFSHTWTFAFTDATKGLWWRIRVDVYFQDGSPKQQWFSNKVLT